jgi:hypothetical protein
VSLGIIEEARALRRELANLAVSPDWHLIARHDLLSGKPPSSFPGRLYKLARNFLSKARLLPPQVTKYRWSPILKHASLAEDAQTLLIWAPGVGRDELRHACEGYINQLRDNASLAPVLVTDVADFAYFSKLGWLVEYLPELGGEGRSYRERKQRYLAWRYRYAVVMPVSAGFATTAEWSDLLKRSR